MKDKHSRSGKVILSLAIIMIAFLCIGINAEAAKKQKLVAKKYTLTVGESTKLTYKNTPKKFKKAKTKWTITSGKKNAKIKVAKNKKSATLVATKAGTVKVKLAYKGKKVGIVKFVIKAKKKTDNKTTKDDNNGKKDITETEDNSNDTNDSKNETTTEAPKEEKKVDYVAKYKYELIPLHPEYTLYTNHFVFDGYYNSSSYDYYLKTTAPSPDYFTIMGDGVQLGESGGTDVTLVMHSITKTYPSGLTLTSETYVRNYAKAYKPNGNLTAACEMSEVEGGYLLSMGTEYAGSYNIDIYEKNVDALGSAYGHLDDPTEYAKAYTLSVNFVDYPTAKKAYIESIAAKAKGEATPEAQVQKIKELLGSDGWVSGGDGHSTGSGSGDLNWKRLSCATGSSLVAQIFNAMGTEYEAEACLASGEADGSLHEQVFVRKIGATEYYGKYESGFNGCTEVVDPIDFSTYKASWE